MEKHGVAKWWRSEPRGLRCELCPHHCLMKSEGVGTCGVRRNVNGRLRSLNYGMVSVLAVDSIEKKPIFHFRPGSLLLSVGTFGCNLDCGFCQNFALARGSAPLVPSTFFSPAALVREALRRGVDGIAYTFNEPIVWAEYVIDTAKISRKRGLYSMINTNGYISPEARELLLENIDVIKVDIKAFREETYQSLCKGRLEPVLETCVVARGKGLHLEVAYPMVPGVNDSPPEMRGFFEWIADNLGSGTPVHLIRVSPLYRMSSLPAESLARMREARSEALATGLEYVYFGGVVSREGQNTRCPGCGTLLVSRAAENASEKLYVRKEEMSRFCPAYSDVKVWSRGGRCPKCGEAIGIRFA